MNRRKTIFGITAILVIGLFVSFVLWQNHKQANTANISMGSTHQMAVVTDKVAIQNYMFSPMTIKVKAGTTVTWTNDDQVHHTVTASRAGGPSSQQLAQGQRYQYTFTKAGTYTYDCMDHPYMRATVIVTS